METSAYFLKTNKVVPPTTILNRGTLQIVTQPKFPVLNGLSGAIIELYDDSMRLPHWHPDANEMGYIISGTIEVYLWLSFGETSVFTVNKGECYFIPIGALHSLNKISGEDVTILLGFDNANFTSTDLPVAYNGIPIPVRTAYTSPHSQLKNYVGPISNPGLGQFPPAKKYADISSPYRANFQAVTPLFHEPDVGSVIWAVKSNWPILKGLSIIRNQLCPGITRDAIWYPDAAVLYIVTRGKGKFNLVIAGHEPVTKTVRASDMIFVPQGILHCFYNDSDKKLELIGFFSNENPSQEVSLAVSTYFFPPGIRNYSLTHYGNESRPGQPLEELKDFKKLPYLLRYSCE